MLRSNEHGYAVMNKEKTSFTIEDISLDVCKKYCGDKYIICERIPYVCGISIKFCIYDYYKWFRKGYGDFNILWLHIYWSKEYAHKSGATVYTNPTSK